jgi:hypothetical protein
LVIVGALGIVGSLLESQVWNVSIDVILDSSIRFSDSESLRLEMGSFVVRVSWIWAYDFPIAITFSTVIVTEWFTRSSCWRRDFDGSNICIILVKELEIFKGFHTSENS